MAAAASRRWWAFVAPIVGEPATAVKHQHPRVSGGEVRFVGVRWVAVIKVTGADSVGEAAGTALHHGVGRATPSSSRNSTGAPVSASTRRKAEGCSPAVADWAVPAERRQPVSHGAADVGDGPFVLGVRSGRQFRRSCRDRFRILPRTRQVQTFWLRRRRERKVACFEVAHNDGAGHDAGGRAGSFEGDDVGQHAGDGERGDPWRCALGSVGWGLQ